MAYTDNPHQRAVLRKAIEKDRECRSGMEFANALSSFLVAIGQQGFRFDSLDALSKRIREFSKGGPWRSGTEKRAMWDMYVHDGAITDLDQVPDTLDYFTRSAERYFKHDTLEKNRMRAMCGGYFVHKRAVRDPDAKVIRYLMAIKENTSGGACLLIQETHCNQTFKPEWERPIFEYWDGCIVPRSHCYFAMTRELEMGTPKTMIFHSPEMIDGHVKKLLGSSMESVENWGRGPHLESKVFAERIPEDWKERKINAYLDIVTREQLLKERTEIAEYIFGGNA